ncbi:MAG TPA: FkbM family methyltransferase [bacterium]
MKSSQPAAPPIREEEGAEIEALLRYDCWLAKSLVRVVPKSRGSWLIGAAAARLLPARYRRSNLVLSMAGKTVRITFDIADPVQFSMVGHFDFDLMTASIVASVLNGGDTFVDVGANWGYFTCIGASQVGPTGLVLAIEPSRVANRRLHETVRRNRLANVMIVQYAAGSVVGREVSVVRPFFRQTTSSYVRDRHPGRASDAVTTTLDALLDKVTAGPVRLIKIDTEGSELPVVQGAASVLDRDHPLVMLEASHYCRRFGYTLPQLYDYMREHGYVSAYRVDGDLHQMALSGPLAHAREGQILFRHERSPACLFAKEMRAHISIG